MRINMKSLILKDLYNIGHNSKSMLFILLVFAFILIPMYGAENYIFICAILCCMMIVTTFSFDDNSDWTKYAMIMPVSKKDIVIGKFITLLVFNSIGTLTGIVIGTIGSAAIGKFSFTLESILSLLFMSLSALTIAEIFGSMSIPLVYKFGAEKGRMLLLISFLIPAGIFFLFYRLFLLLGIPATDKLFFILLCCAPVFAFIWNYIMYKISLLIFSGKEL